MPSDAIEFQGLLPRTLKAIGWNTACLVIGFPIKLGLNILLMRLVAPDVYGIVAIALVLVAMSETLVDAGFKSSLIHQNKVDRNDYASVFFLNLGVASLVYVVVFAASFALDRMTSVEHSGYAARLIGMVIVLRSVYLVQIADANIRLDFRKLTLIEFASYVSAYAIAIVMASCDSGLNSLIAFHLLVPFVSLILFWSTTTWLPRLSEVRKALILRHWNFGKNLLGVSTLDMIASRMDVIVVGRCLVPQSLGFLTKAREYADLVATSSSKLFSKPALAIFSKIRHDHARHRTYFLDSIALVAAFYAPVVVLLAVNSEWIFEFTLGEKWSPLSGLFQILLLGSQFYVLSGFARYTLLSTGSSRENLTVTFFKSVVRMLGIALLASLYFGKEILVYVVVVWEIFVHIFEAILVAYFLRIRLDVHVTDLAQVLVGPAIFSALSLSFIAALCYYSSQIPYFNANLGIVALTALLVWRVASKNRLLQQVAGIGYRALRAAQAA